MYCQRRRFYNRLTLVQYRPMVIFLLNIKNIKGAAHKKGDVEDMCTLGLIRQRFGLRTRHDNRRVYHCVTFIHVKFIPCGIMLHYRINTFHGYKYLCVCVAIFVRLLGGGG